MAVLWLLHELLTVVMFWNLPSLHLQEQLERIEADNENTQPVSASGAQPAAANTEIVSTDCAISPVVLFMPQEPVHVTQSAVPSTVHCSPLVERQLDVSDTSSVTMSNDFIEEAEELMQAEWLDGDRSTIMSTRESSSAFDADAVQHLSWPCIIVSPISRTNSDSFLQQRRQFYGSVKHETVGRNIVLTTSEGPADGQTGVLTARDTEVSPTVHDISSGAAEPEQSSNSLTWRYYYDGQSLSVMHADCTHSLVMK